MRILAIGDIHGRKKWESLQSEVVDRVIFIGDYFDNFHINQSIQIENFKNILAWKEREPEKVILLFGNHDYHYFLNGKVQYSGFRANGIITQLVQEAVQKKLVQLLHIEGNYLFSHAGISSRWLELVYQHEKLTWSEVKDVLYYKPRILDFGCYGYPFSEYGDDPEQGPLWIRPRSLREYPLEGYIQVVGHTTQRNVTIEGGLILIDSPENGEVLEIIDQKANIYLCQNYTL